MDGIHTDNPYLYNISGSDGRNGGDGMQFNGAYFDAAADANITFIGGGAGAGSAAGSYTDSDGTVTKGKDGAPGIAGKPLVYEQGVFSSLNYLQPAVAKENIISLTLRYPYGTKTCFTGKNTKITAGNLPLSAVEHYRFESWYTDEGYTSLFDDTQALTEDLTLSAKYMPELYKIRFFTGDDSITIPDQKVSYNTSATEPSRPVRTGYIFDGWFSDPDYTTFCYTG